MLEEEKHESHAMRVLRLGFRVFGEQKVAERWMNLAQHRLHERSPMEMLATDAGCRIVEGLLWQIDDGIYT